LEHLKRRRWAVSLAMISALAFWGINAGAYGPRLVYSARAGEFMGNISLAVTFITSVSAAVAAFEWVMRRGFVIGRDAVSGVCGRTVLIPAAIAVATMLVGAAVSAVAMGHWVGTGWAAMFCLLAWRYLPVGAGAALMGSLVGNLAGSVTLEAKDLGRWARLNLVLFLALVCFWMFVLWAVRCLLAGRTGASIP
jgi:hypothetical protein